MSTESPDHLLQMRDELSAAGAVKLVEIGEPAQPQPFRYSFNYWVEVWRVPKNPEQAKLLQLASCQDPRLSGFPSAIR